MFEQEFLLLWQAELHHRQRLVSAQRYGLPLPTDLSLQPTREDPSDSSAALLGPHTSSAVPASGSVQVPAWMRASQESMSVLSTPARSSVSDAAPLARSGVATPIVSNEQLLPDTPPRTVSRSAAAAAAGNASVGGSPAQSWQVQQAQAFRAHQREQEQQQQAQRDEQQRQFDERRREHEAYVQQQFELQRASREQAQEGTAAVAAPAPARPSSTRRSLARSMSATVLPPRLARHDFADDEDADGLGLDPAAARGARSLRRSASELSTWPATAAATAAAPVG